MVELIAETGDFFPKGWDDLAKQMPIVAVVLLVCWYLFGKISDIHESRLKSSLELMKDNERLNEERFKKMIDAMNLQLVHLKEAQTKIETIKDEQIAQLTELLKQSRVEKEKIIAKIDKKA